MDKAYTFSDVAIKQKFFRGKSRNDVDTSSDLGFFKLSIPIMTANMKSVTGSKMAIAAAESGAMGILHRFNTIDQAVQEFQDVMCLEETSITASGCVEVDVLKDVEYVTYTKSSATPVRRPINPYGVGVSVGVQEYDKARFDRLYAAGAKVFCIDISHGWQESMKQMITWIRGLGLKDVCLMAGNVADREGIYDLANWGADIVKCGIGPGAACMTRRFTGVGAPQLWVMEQARDEVIKQGLKVKLVSDGGVRYTSDINKAMKFSDAVMVGKFVAGTAETPGAVYQNPKGEFYKVYAGSASGENKTSNGQSTDFTEGITMEVPFRGKVKYIFRNIKQGMQSGFSLAGSMSLKEFQEKCEFNFITDGGREESKI